MDYESVGSEATKPAPSIDSLSPGTQHSTILSYTMYRIQGMPGLVRNPWTMKTLEDRCSSFLPLASTILSYMLCRIQIIPRLVKNHANDSFF